MEPLWKGQECLATLKLQNLVHFHSPFFTNHVYFTPHDRPPLLKRHHFGLCRRVPLYMSISGPKFLLHAETVDRVATCQRQKSTATQATKTTANYPSDHHVEFSGGIAGPFLSENSLGLWVFVVVPHGSHRP